MNRISSVALLLLLVGSVGFGQTAPPATTSPMAGTSKAVGHGAFPVKLTKTLDSSKLKEGDAVVVETVGSFKLPDGTLVPKGSKLSGHVTASKARSKGDANSELTIAFDQLDVTDGKHLSVKGTVQAVFPPQEEGAPILFAGAASGAAGGGHSGGGEPVGMVTNAKSGSDTNASGKPVPAVDPKSVGVQGIHDLELGQKGELFSGGKQVKLGNGVRMIVRVDILG